MKNIKSYKLFSLVALALAFFPSVSFAAVTVTCNLGEKPGIQDIFNYLTCILSKSVVAFIFGLALVLFFWGVVQYVINADSDTERAKGKQFMIWGIIALTVMFAVYGLVRILAGTFGIDVDALPKLPIPTGDN